MENVLNFKKYHFVGVLGSSMSGLAEFLLKQKKKVSGSDKNYNSRLKKLKSLGGEIYIGSYPEKVEEADVVIYTSAVRPNDCELITAKKFGIPCLERSKFLGLLAENFGNVIAVSGTHGKSTVTGMIGNIFSLAEKNPFVHIGGEVKRKATKCAFDYMITEACEYKEGFLNVKPDCAVILNVESDHPDCYDSLDELYSVFSEFAAKIKDGGTLVKPAGMNFSTSAKTISVGENVLASSMTEEGGYYSFVPVVENEEWQRIKMGIPGVHNVYNALFAIAVGVVYGIDREKICEGVETFSGVERRFQTVQSLNGAKVVVDYAHHPTEIRAAISTAKSMTSGRIITVFQPHTYSRTAKLFEDFKDSFSGSDIVILVKEFPAREDKSCGKSAKDLYDSMVKDENAFRLRYADDLSSVKMLMAKYAYPGDIILVLGAGDVNTVVDY